MANLGFKVKVDGVSGLKDVKKEYDKAKSSVQEGILIGVGVKVAEGAMSAVKKLYSTVAGDGLAAAAEYSLAEKKLLNFTKTAKDAATANRIAESFGNTPPFDYEEALRGTKLLMAMGTEVENLETELTAMGNVAAAGEMSLTTFLERLMLGYESGKVGSREMREMMKSGIPITDALARAMGVARGEVGKLISDGKVGFGELKTAIMSLGGAGGQFENEMERLAHEYGGLREIVGAKWEDVQRGLMTEMMEPVNQGLEVAVNLLSEAEEGAHALGEGVRHVVVIAGPLVASLALVKVVAQLRAAGSGIMAMGAQLRGAGASARAADHSVRQLSADLAAAGQAGNMMGTLIKNGFTEAEAKAISMQMAVRGVRAEMASARAAEASAARRRTVGRMATGGALLAAGLAADFLMGDAADMKEGNDLAGNLAKLHRGLGDDFGNVGGLFGNLEEKEQGLEKINEKLKEAYDLLHDAETLDAGWLDGGLAKRNAIGNAKNYINQLGIVKERIEGVTDAQMSSVAAERLYNAEQRKAEQAMVKRAEDLGRIREKFEEDTEAARVDGMGGSLGALRARRDELLGGYVSVENLSDGAEVRAGFGDVESRAQAADMYERASKVLKLDKQIADEEKRIQEAKEKILEQYDLQVRAVVAEAEGDKAKMDSLKEQWAIKKKIADLEDAGFSKEEAAARGEAYVKEEIEAKRRLELVKEEREEEKKRRKERADAEREFKREHNRAMREKVAAGTEGSGGMVREKALEVIGRTNDLMEKYGEFGMTKGRAERIAMNEAYFSRSNDTNVMASSIQSIGGGGAVVATGFPDPQRQESLLKEQVRLLQKIYEAQGL